ncbi:MAG: cob(I)yrinic acid a,c-diamide adenosyltransferase [Paenibacillaceae bacterium]
MKIYTRTGDEGQTSVIGGRVSKDDIRVETYGTIDELNSFVGIAASIAGEHKNNDDLLEQLLQIQHELFDCGSDLAYVRKGDRNEKVQLEMTEQLEAWIDQHQEEAPPLRRFILPGGSLLSSQLHVCRTVCRRAERLVITMARTEEVNAEVRRYLNRLSDYFFTMARVVNAREGVGDVEYVRGANVFMATEQ